METAISGVGKLLRTGGFPTSFSVTLFERVSTKLQALVYDIIPSRWKVPESGVLVWVNTRVAVVVVVVRELGYEDCLPHDSSFRLLLRSHHSEFVGAISILFCYINIKLITFFVE